MGKYCDGLWGAPIAVISIRFDPAIGRHPDIKETASVTLSRATDCITCESEKNRPQDRTNVDRYLRPLIAETWARLPPLFRVIGIETRAGCNATCGFCPVNKHADRRQSGELETPLVKKLAAELGELQFCGTIQLFGNNEPLQDPRMVEFVRLFRSACAAAQIRLLTNGTLLTVKIAEALFKAGLSVLTINNYTDGRRLIRSVQHLIADAERFCDFDVRISVRKINEVLTSRGNRAPNKIIPRLEHGGGFCALPFVDMQIDYRGQVIGCCFDSYSELVLGDVHKSNLSTLWFADSYSNLRTSLLARNRSSVIPCSGCDFDGFGDPFQNPMLRLTREALNLLEQHVTHDN
jgi:hypothetical protein